MSINQQQIQALTDEYHGLVDILGRYANEIRNQLTKLIEDDGIHLGFPILSRVKTLESALEKIERLNFHLKNIKEFQDLVGLRIIVLFSRDAEKINKIITDNFLVIKQYNTKDRLKEDQFGYLSTHFVIKTPEKWTTLPTFRGMNDLQAEIQIRTLAQHTWSEASRTLQYKSVEAVPSSILRSTYRLSALLETVDLELERILNQRELYKDDLVTKSSDKLNVDILENVLDAMLPRANKTENEGYSDLLLQLISFEIDTKEELEKIINKHLSSTMQTEREFVAFYQEKIASGAKSIGASKERILNEVYYTYTGLVRNILRKEFGDNYYKPHRLQNVGNKNVKK